jgi:hypothetical protein
MSRSRSCRNARLCCGAAIAPASTGIPAAAGQFATVRPDKTRTLTIPTTVTSDTSAGVPGRKGDTADRRTAPLVISGSTKGQRDTRSNGHRHCGHKPDQQHRADGIDQGGADVPVADRSGGVEGEGEHAAEDQHPPGLAELAVGVAVQ